MPRVLVTDEIDRAAISLLSQHCVVQEESAVSPQVLLEVLRDADAIIVRSSTRITREAIEAASHLQVIGRAGAGVDNIDVAAATEKGIWVVNAPDSNSIAVAEHVFALMLALARHIPQANSCMQSGGWNRSSFRGEELYGKRLGIIGLGRIGTKVAERAKAFGMEVVAHDPFISPSQAASLSVDLLPLDGLLTTSDFVSIHVPASASTQALLGERDLRSCKPTTYLINCARGSVVDEKALLKALNEGWIAGAGLDVFAEEPPGASALVRHPKVVATPHIAGLTSEAQRNVAVAVAQQVIDVLAGRRPAYPVNAPALSPELQRRMGPYIDLSRRLGLLYAEIAEAPTISVEATYSGQVADTETALLTAAALEGLLTRFSEAPVNVINSRLLARARGITVTETTQANCAPYSSLVSFTVRTTSRNYRIAGTVVHGQPYVVEMDAFVINFVPAGTLLYTEHIEQPGILGRMGTLLGERGVNISFVQVGRHTRRGRGIMILGIDDDLDDRLLRDVCDLPSVRLARVVHMPDIQNVT